MIGREGLAIAAAMTATAFAASAQAPAQPRSERLVFARGASSVSVRGTVRGYDSVDYIVGGRGGQMLDVTMRSPNGSAYFNVLPSRSPEAIFIGSTSGNQFSGRLPASGDYRIRVYLMRNAARRGETAVYNLTVGIDSRPGLPGPGAGAGPGNRPGAGPIGNGPPLPPGNMAAFCRGEAAQQYAVRPRYVTTGRAVPVRGGGSTIDGTVDKGSEGIKRFRCRFDQRMRFIDVMAMTRDGF